MFETLRAPCLVCCLLASGSLKAYLTEAQRAWTVAQAGHQKVYRNTAETSKTARAHETRL